MPFELGPKAKTSGYRLAAYETIGSTSTEALERAREGDPGRLWIVAKAQTAGHGRRGRAWETASGNLAASLLLRVSSPPAMIATLGFVAGLAVESAIRGVAAISSPYWGEADSERPWDRAFRAPKRLLPLRRLRGRRWCQILGLLARPAPAESTFLQREGK
jgi:BirA family biotin operon repressor/biotin-[acetyl-CoA-carboxylase] ligase